MSDSMTKSVSTGKSICKNRLFYETFMSVTYLICEYVYKYTYMLYVVQF